MTSQKQIEANRINATYSTGPKTDIGRAAVSQNAVTHGLRAQRVVIQGESPYEFDDFRENLVAHLDPANPLEMLLVDRIAAGFWRLRRTGQIEAQMFDELRRSSKIKDKEEAAGVPVFDDILPEDLPPRSPSMSLDEAKAAWNASEDGFAFSQGSLSIDAALESFDKFIRKAADMETPVTDDDLLERISQMKESCDPQMFQFLTELEKTFRSICKIPPGRRSIAAARQLIQEMSTLEPLNEQWQNRISRDLAELKHIEESIERRRKTDLGRTLCSDLKGPDTLSKFTRYETQIERGLFKAMHELQRLQAMRCNLPVAAPLAVDIDISGDTIT